MITAETPSNPFIPAPFEIIWSLVFVAIFAVFIIKYLMPKMTAILDERAAKIEGGLELADKAQAEAAEARAETARQLAAARREAAGMREEANSDATQLVAVSAASVLQCVMPRLAAILDERAARIEGGLELADRAQAEAAEARAETERQLAAARREAAGIREEANSDASQIVAEAKTKAQP